MIQRARGFVVNPVQKSSDELGVCVAVFKNAGAINSPEEYS